MRLVPVFREFLQEKGLNDLFFNLEMPVMRLLIDMEQKGILLDKAVRVKRIKAEIILKLTLRSMKF